MANEETGWWQFAKHWRVPSPIRKIACLLCIRKLSKPWTSARCLQQHGCVKLAPQTTNCCQRAPCLPSREWPNAVNLWTSYKLCNMKAGLLRLRFLAKFHYCGTSELASHDACVDEFLLHAQHLRTPCIQAATYPCIHRG